MDDAVKFLFSFLALMAGMFMLWVYTGGPERFERENQGAFIKSPAPLSTGESFGTLNPFEYATVTPE